MILKGKVHKFGDHINTDYIISSKYKYKVSSIEEMTDYIFEDIEPDFSRKMASGDIIVAGDNFGCGSSRETAPRVIQASEISCVVAKSFARIFFRNSINIGLPLVICNTDSFSHDEILEIDLVQGTASGSNGNINRLQTLPAVMVKIIQDGGLKNHIIKHGGYAL